MTDPSSPLPDHRPSRGLQLRLLREARPEALRLAGLFLVQLLAIPLALLIPFPLQVAVDSVLGSVPLPEGARVLLPDSWEYGGALLLVCAVTLVLVSVLAQLQDMAAWIYRTWLGEKLILGFRARIFRHLQRLSLAYHDRQPAAHSVYRIQSDASCIETVVVQGHVRVATAAIRLAAMIAVTARIDGTLVLVALIGGPALFGLTQGFSKRLRRRWTEAKERESSEMAVVHEALAAVRVVKAFGQEDRERQRWQKRAEASLEASVRAVSFHGILDALIALTIGLCGAGVLVVGVHHVQAGVITLGQFLLVAGYLSQLFQPLREIGTKLAELQRSLAGAQRTFDLLDEPAEAPERPGALPLACARGEVEFHAVGFAYGHDRPVLRDVTFHVPAGARVGIAGRSGSGKSTLLSLLPRFYDPDSGVIRLDGTDLRDLRLEDLRNQFSFVLQDSVLFSTTIAENIAYGRPQARPEEIMAAATAAGIHEFVASLPQGYDTEVGERGVRLSGGERQRIALARAFLKDAPILVLDEPTSAVDVATEASIMAAIERLMEGRTTFMITHRLNTLASCDVRLEVESGRVFRRGADLTGVIFDPASAG